MRPRSGLLVLFLVLGTGAGGLSAQSIVAGSVEVMVRSPAGEPVASAAVALRPLGAGPERSSVTARAGGATLAFVHAGSYELVVEALGYRPVLVTPVEVPVGERVFVEVELAAAEGVVAEVDTVPYTGARFSRWTPEGVRLRPSVVAGIPTRTEDLTAVARLVSAADPVLGAEGLPASSTTTFLDGLPFTPARHPGLRGQSVWSPVVARSGIAGFQALLAPGDVEWLGGGPIFSATTRTAATSSEPVALEGSWSGSPVWSSTEADFTGREFSSVWGSGHASIGLVPDTSHLFLSADGVLLQLPAAPRLSPSDAGRLGNLDDALVRALTAPTLTEIRRVTGLGRLDWWFSPSTRLGVRAAVGTFDRSLEGAGVPSLEYGAGPAERGVDFSVMGDLTLRESERLTVEFRGGVAGSSRELRGGDAAQALVVEDAALLGGAAGSGADVSRLDVSFASAAHYLFRDASSLKAGGQFRATRHTSRSTPYQGGRFIFADLDAVPAGFSRGVTSDAPEVTFTSAEAGVFAQYLWSPRPGVRFTFGGRADYETFTSEALLDTAFQEATGLDNTAYPTSFITPGFGASALWDLTGGTGRVVFMGAGSLQSGDLDPSFLHEAYASSEEGRVSRYLGTDAGWPGAALPGAAVSRPALSILGPDTRPPQHVRVQGGFLFRVAGSTSLFVGGSARRTDFLVRRRDLNLTASPVVVDQDGRPLLGVLRKEGGLVTVDGESHRRFPGFDAVWALDPDGFSTYRAATVGFEHRGERLELAATYTRSVTEDNWLGAAGPAPEAALAPGVGNGADGDPWAEGRSDFDIPDRLVATARLQVGGFATVGGVYRFESARPFTPGFRRGVDANGDGSGFNDPAFVPAASDLGALATAWPCLTDMAGGFAERNGCRGERRHGLDLRLELRLADIAGRPLQIVVDGLNVLETVDGLRDTALLLVDESGTLGSSDGGARVQVPVRVNPGFGDVLIPDSPGTFVRIGVRLGGR